MKVQSIAPSRISLFGGGTDVEPYALEYGGIVLSLAINLRQHLTIYSKDDLWEISGANIIPHHGSQDFYYQILDEYNLNDMHHTKFASEFDGLLEAGLGSSAA